MKIAVVGTGYVGLVSGACFVTDWDDIRALDLARLKRTMRQPVLIDLRNAYNPGAAESLGFRVVAIGRAAARYRRDPIVATATARHATATAVRASDHIQSS